MTRGESVNTAAKVRGLKLRDDDNVVVVLDPAPAGAPIAGYDLIASQATPPGHKIAARDIAQGEAIRKYGQIIGFAKVAIAKGAHVHVANVELLEFDRNSEFGSRAPLTRYVDAPATFMGYRRDDGRAGTRNYIGIVTTVNCSATVARYIADTFRGDRLADYPAVDGVVALTHGSGCCMGADEDGMKQLNRTLAGFARHPNFAGVIIAGLGCETNQIATILDDHDLHGRASIRTLGIQESGGTRKTVEAGVAMVEEFLQGERSRRREPVPASELMVGLECGGSDGYSGISANPALGRAADLLVANGGTAILSETPEIYGAEHLLTDRADSPAVAQKLMQLIRWWEDYTQKNGSKMDNNPSPGNKDGGLTTILEKSLGAVAKGGSTRLMDVYRYAETITSRGFVFMDSPGYDPASITGQMASGANLICFTTGRGSVFGSKPAPCIKIATNSSLYQRMSEDMDVNAGRIIDGSASVDEVGQEIFKLMLRVASGEEPRSEALGFGDHEFTPWVFGAQM